MKNSAFYKIAKRELHIIKNRRLFFLLAVAVPVLLYFSLAFIYVNGVLNEIPTAVCDMDNTQLSRKVVQYFDATSAVKIVDNASSIEDIKKGMQKGKYYAAVYIPKNFEKDIKSNNSPKVTVYKNTSNLVIGNNITKAAASAVQTISTGAFLKKLQSAGKMKDNAFNIANAITVNAMPLYNPNYNYLNFLIPGVAAFFIQMCFMVAGAMIFVTDFSNGGKEELKKLANGKLAPIFFGKAIPHFLLQMTTVFILIGILFPMFDVPVRAGNFNLFVLLLVFSIASFLPGLVISLLSKDEMNATQTVIFINTPAFVFSGLTFPIWSMPLLHKVIAALMPLTPALEGMLKLHQIGTPFGFVTGEMLHLMAFIVVSLLVLPFLLKRKMSETASQNKEGGINV